MAQPLRVEDGAVEFSLPTGRTPEGVVTGRWFSAPLAVVRSAQPQHQRHAPAEWLAFVAYRATW